MNYQTDAQGQLEVKQSYDANVIESGNGGLDYAILETDGPAGTDWGINVPAAFSEPAGQAITLIQHPGGSTKKIDGGTLMLLDDRRIGFDDLDAIGGSSGSGVLRTANGNVIGIFTGGSTTCDASHPNDGRSMLEYSEQSPILNALAIDAAKLVALR